MEYIKINDNLYPAEINGSLKDPEWEDRKTKSITLEMDYFTAASLFVDGVAWSIVIDIYNEDATVTQEEYDNSEYAFAGDITDHRDGTITVKMGKPTDLEEAYEIMYGGM